MHWAVRYVGVPFREIGFDLSGCHCWGLVVLVYRNERGIALPRHDTINAEQLLATARAFASSSAVPPWQPVRDDRRDFDVVLMGADEKDGDGVLRRYPSHIGLAVGRNRVLHVERGVDAVCVPSSHWTVCHRIIGAWRHEALA